MISAWCHRCIPRSSREQCSCSHRLTAVRLAAAKIFGLAKKYQTRANPFLLSGLPFPSGKKKKKPRRYAVTFVDDTRVELDGHGVPDNLAKKTGGVFAFPLRGWTVLHLSLNLHFLSPAKSLWKGGERG